MTVYTRGKRAKVDPLQTLSICLALLKLMILIPLGRLAGNSFNIILVLWPLSCRSNSSQVLLGLNKTLGNFSSIAVFRTKG